MTFVDRRSRTGVVKMGLSAAVAGAVMAGGAGMAQACDNGSGSQSGQAAREAGPVQSVSGDVISLTNRQGATQTVDTNGSTVFESGGGQSSLGQVAPGDWAWAEGTPQSGGTLMAAKVLFGSRSSSSGTGTATEASHFSGSGQQAGDDQGGWRHHHHHHDADDR